jgi:cytochrome c553
MKKKSISAILLTLICISGIILSFDYAPSVPANGFKNLKILPKDISKKALDSTMEYYAASLGVRCGFCHARNSDTTKRGLDFASDAKEEKSRAREMMTMTTYVNTTYFNEAHTTKTDTIHTVTCFTCHRGNNEPTEKNLLPKYNAIKPEHKKK